MGERIKDDIVYICNQYFKCNFKYEKDARTNVLVNNNRTKFILFSIPRSRSNGNYHWLYFYNDNYKYIDVR